MGIPWPLRRFAPCFGVALLAATAAIVLSAAAPIGSSFLADRLEAYPTDETRSGDRVIAPVVYDSEAGAPRIAAPGTTTPLDEATVREILDIRRERGGVLSRTLLDELSRSATGDRADAMASGRWEEEEEFARALRGVASAASSAHRQASPQPQMPPSEIPRPEVSRVESSPVESRPSALSDPPPLPVLGSLGRDEPLDDVQLVRALRYAARQLDRKANDLEDVQRYGDADQLRVLSERLRQESRRWVRTPMLPQEPPETPLAPVPVQ